MNHYQTLELSEHATPQEIKQAFMELRDKYRAENNEKDLEQLIKAYKALMKKKSSRYDNRYKAFILVMSVLTAIMLPLVLEMAFPEYFFLWIYFVYVFVILSGQVMSAIMNLILFLMKVKVDGVSRRGHLTNREKAAQKRTLAAFLLMGLIIPVTAILWSFLHEEEPVWIAGMFVGFFLAVGLALYDPITAMIAQRRGKPVTVQTGRRFLILSIFILALLMGFLGHLYIPQDINYREAGLIFSLLLFLCCIISLVLELWKMAKFYKD